MSSLSRVFLILPITLFACKQEPDPDVVTTPDTDPTTEPGTDTPTTPTSTTTSTTNTEKGEWVECDTDLAAASTGVCDVSAGSNSATVLRGDVITESQVLLDRKLHSMSSFPTGVIQSYQHFD